MKINHYLFHAGISCFFYFATGCYYTVMALYMGDVGGMNASQIAMITSATPLFSIATQPLLGSIADKVKSPRLVSIVSIIVAILANILFIVNHSFIGLLISSGLVLSIYNAVTPLTDRIGTAAPYDFGKIRIFGSIGYAISAQINGIIYDSISPYAPYILFIAAAIITLICIYMTYDPEVSTKEGEEDSYSVKEAYTSLFKNKQFMIFLIINIFFWSSSMCNNTYLSVFFKSVGGNASQVGTYQLIATMFEIPMILASDYFLRRFSYKQMIMFPCIMAIVNFAWYATLPTPTMIIAAFFFKGCAILFTMCQVKLVMELVDPRYVSTAYALMYMAGKGVGTVIVQLVAGNLIDGFATMTPYYLFLTVLAVLAFIFCFFLKIERKRI